MNTEPCSIIAELLVDFADGELAGEQRRRVADHLSTCPGCRAELRLLERSLELAKSVWEQAAVSPDKDIASYSRALSRISKMLLTSRFRLHSRWAIAACLAVCVLLLLASTTWWLPQLRQNRQPIGTIARQPENPPPALSNDSIDSFISSQARSARLAVAVQILANQPELKTNKAHAERYLAEVSRDTRLPP
jgi:anti-sigma factor RsiW